MKILSSFDTKLDENMLLLRKQEYEDTFLIKRHWFFLIGMGVWGFLTLLTFVILASVLYYLLPFEYFLLITTLNILGIGIWLTLTFVQLYKYLKNYSFIKKEITNEELEDGLLEKYLKFSLWLFIYQIILAIITTILGFNLNPGNGINSIMLNITQLITSILFLYFIYKTLYVLINFEMDFTIITNKDITFYNQSGIFKRNSNTVSVDKIKSIQANKKGILRALLDFGEIIILTEGDSTGGEQKLKYIPKPEIVKNKIIKVLHMNNGDGEKNK